jgi:hypothetical protein
MDQRFPVILAILGLDHYHQPHQVATEDQLFFSAPKGPAWTVLRVSATTQTMSRSKRNEFPIEIPADDLLDQRLDNSTYV